ncbi:ABL010Wp [Eremothecium gossypii ATCC 10895]|uniref:ABL010Wp n=1 Tax=Eremothecium gossypii (strain ATCC 10895 / CBS 109.51 / FGSC 9923 / NRRL Y-1056) TaxID=284811 RepID=Q75DM7_EREGS|nr:ABL010Wp [Eremothecium gossypii ATCC 10895]AAS50761.1 ABL010Wp [Eremothecium gossypii ATCC 10895]
MARGLLTSDGCTRSAAQGRHPCSFLPNEVSRPITRPLPLSANSHDSDTMPDTAKDEVPDRVLFQRGGRTLEVHGARFMRPHTVVKPWEQKSHAPAEDASSSLLQAGGHRPAPAGAAGHATDSEKEASGRAGRKDTSEGQGGDVSPRAARSQPRGGSAEH